MSQLRSDIDRPGPGPEDAASSTVPYLGDWIDTKVPVGGQTLTLRIWSSWVAILAQTCELDNQGQSDSRVLVAPVAFRRIWEGHHWVEIRSGRAMGFLHLPPLTKEDRAGLGAEGWHAETDAAIVFGNTTLISRELVGTAAFGLTGQARSLLQEKLVKWWSVRNWQSVDWAGEIEGKRILKVEKTDVIHREKGVLYKVHLGNGKDDEVSVGMVFRP